MKVIDLSQVISAEMPVYPGTEGPRISAATTIARDGFAEKLLHFYSHTGTHIDAPGHMIAGGPTLDRFEAGQFLGTACVLEVSGSLVEAATLEREEARIAACDFLLLRSGWSARWGGEDYFSGFPTLSVEAARLLSRLGLKGLGVDCISVDPVGSPDFPVHRVLLGAGMLIIENLRRLEGLPRDSFLFSCLPLRLEDADGSPVRAVALLETGRDADAGLAGAKPGKPLSWRGGEAGRIRDALPGDGAAVARLAGELGYPTSAEAATQRIAALIDRREERFRVAVDGEGEILGWCSLEAVRRVYHEAFLEVTGLVVTAAARGRGLGTALMADAEDLARAAGLGLVRLRSNALRLEAHAFYAGLGYERSKTQYAFQKQLGR